MSLAAKERERKAQESKLRDSIGPDLGSGGNYSEQGDRSVSGKQGNGNTGMSM